MSASRPFHPGVTDYEGSMARDYDAARALSPRAEESWRAAFEPHLGSVETVLDVGSGTGRFTVLIARWFGAVVTGVEPAGGMRRSAVPAGEHANVRYVAGRAEQLPLKDDSFAAAVLSNVYHHVSDRAACARELHRVLRAGARLLIRGAFAGRLRDITLFEFFPEAKVVCEQFPSLEETVENFTAWGFEVDTVRRVSQETCSSLGEFAARTRLRADTTLALLTDEEFDRRQQALECAAAGETSPAPVVDTLDLLVLRRRAARGG